MVASETRNDRRNHAEKVWTAPSLEFTAVNRRAAGRWTVILAVSVALAGCGAISSDSDTGIDPQDPELVARGDELYAANCAQCHGEDLRGTDRGPSHLSRVYEPSHHADGSFQLAVQLGAVEHHWDFGPMPPVEGLSEADVEAIVAFVRETQRIEGFEPYPP